MIALLLASSLARAVDLDLQLGPSLGVETVTNDAFVKRTGVRLGFNLAPVPWLEAGVDVVYFPVLGGEDDWTALSKQIQFENSVTPDISLLVANAQATVRVLPLQAAFKHGWRTRVGGLAGGGAVYTQDSAEALQVDASDPDYAATANQIHGAFTMGLLGEIRHDHFGLRVRYERTSYIETVSSVVLEMKSNALIGTEVMFWFP